MGRSALFVIDIQHLLVGDPDTEIPAANRIRDAGTALLQRAREAIDSSRGEGKKPPLSIVFVQHEETPENGPLVRGSRHWQLTFEPREGDAFERLVAKTEGDTFASNPQLASELKDNDDIDHIVAFGIQSECCVRATVKGALARGFKVTVLHGAHSTYDEGGKTAAQIEKEVEDEVSASGAEVIAWEEWSPSS